jgi:hypothetical protein
MQTDLARIGARRARVLTMKTQLIDWDTKNVIAEYEGFVTFPVHTLTILDRGGEPVPGRLSQPFLATPDGGILTYSVVLDE